MVPVAVLSLLRPYFGSSERAVRREIDEHVKEARISNGLQFGGARTHRSHSPGSKVPCKDDGSKF